MLQQTNFYKVFFSILHKKLPALNAQLNLRNSFTLKSFKYLKSKKFQTFLFPIIGCG